MNVCLVPMRWAFVNYLLNALGQMPLFFELVFDCYLPIPVKHGLYSSLAAIFDGGYAAYKRMPSHGSLPARTRLGLLQPISALTTVFEFHLRRFKQQPVDLWSTGGPIRTQESGCEAAQRFALVNLLACLGFPVLHRYVWRRWV